MPIFILELLLHGHALFIYIAFFDMLRTWYDGAHAVSLFLVGLYTHVDKQDFQVGASRPLGKG